MKSSSGIYVTAAGPPGSCFLSKRRLIALVFLALVLIVASGILGGFFGPSRLDSKTRVTSKQSRLSAQTTSRPSIKTTSSSEKKLWEDTRLPTWILPSHYMLEIRLDLSAKLFNGTVSIDIQCQQKAQFIILHCKQLNVRSVNVQNQEGALVDVARHFLYVKNEYLVIELKDHLRKGKALVTVQFDAPLALDLTGFYFSSYPELDGSYGKVAATMFAPVAARKAFPCFDEPAMKANFTLTIIHSKKYVAIANMPLANKSSTSDGRTRSDFKTSIKMSTYLLCFVVCSFKYTETVTRNGVHIRVWAPKHLLSQTKYALRAANYTLPYFENLFQIKYPLSKLDMIALPSFIAGAMENWGLITYRATRLLTRSTKSKGRLEQDILAIVAHELAHQWFGNLVTMDWWNDVWLNEGFASYIEYFGANSFDPSLRMLNQFLLLDLYPVMDLDSYQSSHPLSMHVEKTNEINQIFDIVTYNKGASILRMLRNYMGHDQFFMGLRNYLKKYAYKNAKQDDLWNELRKVSNLDIKGIMDTWTLQLGFPVVNASRLDTNRVLLTQNYFTLDETRQSGLQKSPFNYTWQIPITFFEGSNPNVIKSTVMKTASTIINVPDKHWFKLNKDHNGYFRVVYDEHNWNMLMDQLHKNHSFFSPLDRASLISDIFNMAYSGKVKYKTALKSTKYLRKEREWVPWKTGIDSVAKMNSILSKTCFTRKLLQTYLNSLVEPTVSLFGWTNQTKVANAYLQTMALEIASQAGNERVISQAQTYFRNWIRGGQQIPARLKPIVYYVGVQRGGEQEWDRVFKEYNTTKDIGDKRALLNALGASPTPWIVKRFLQYTLDEDKIPKEDSTYAIIAAAKGSSDGRFFAWDFIRHHWDEILNKFSDGIFLLGRMIRGVLSDFSNEYELEMVETFFKSKTNLGSAAQAVKQVITKIKTNINWKKQHENDIKDWLMSNTLSYS